MNLTMLTIGSTGDVKPFLILGSELHARGHQVTIATFSRFQSQVESAHLCFFQLSGDAEYLMANLMAPGKSGISYLSRLEKGIKAVAPRLLQDMCASCEHADAIICNFFGSVYYSVAEKYSIPCIQTHYFPMDPSRDFPIPVLQHQHLGGFLNQSSFMLGYLMIGAVERRYLGDWRKQNKLSKRKIQSKPDYQVSGHPIPVIYAVSPSVLPRPVDWGPHIHLSGFWFDDHPAIVSPPADLKRFLEAGDKPVYIGFGSMNAGNMQRLMAIVLRAVHASGLRAVIQLGWSGLKMTSTRQVFFADYVPHDWLFSKVCAVVHHGGAGTTAAGLLHGLPTLVIPFSGDQSFWGNRIYQLGCGPKPIQRNSITVHRLTRGLQLLTGTPAYQQAASEMSRRLQSEHGAKKAADLIEQEIAAW